MHPLQKMLLLLLLMGGAGNIQICHSFAGVPTTAPSTSSEKKTTLSSFKHRNSNTTVSSSVPLDNHSSNQFKKNKRQPQEQAKDFQQILNQIGKTKLFPNIQNRPTNFISDKLFQAIKHNKHPINEKQSELGQGIYIANDWQHAWYTYKNPTSTIITTKNDSNNKACRIINDHDGSAEYEITEIDGIIPTNLHGVLYRNGPGKFGINGQRVSHVLDADGLIIQIIIPPSPPSDVINGKRRKIMFKSRFIETKGFLMERELNKFVMRGTFGTGRSPELPVMRKNKKKKEEEDAQAAPGEGIDSDPIPKSAISKIIGNAFQIEIKNTANTHVISFGGKVLALFEAGLPHAINPKSLETIGEDDMGGTLPTSNKGSKVAVTMDSIPKEYLPDFMGGAAHTAHPKLCPRTGNLVGWHWTRVFDKKGMKITFTEWSQENFHAIASKTHFIPGCDLAPHDMAITESCILMIVNALKMDEMAFMSGLKGPAEALTMNGKQQITAHVLPRPTSKNQFEPFTITVPACFIIHLSHAYEDEQSGNIVAFFSGWPPSDAKDFLGAWGGFNPDYTKIPETYLWRIELDPVQKETVSFSVVPGAELACAEFPVVHPYFRTRKARFVYGTVSNLIGDSSAPCGYARFSVEERSDLQSDKTKRNELLDNYFFGTRYFVGEPLVVPKEGADLAKEDAAYMLGMVFDAVRRLSFVVIFDLEHPRPMSRGPICRLWLKTHVPHGLHGCFARDNAGGASVFC